MSSTCHVYIILPCSFTFRVPESIHTHSYIGSVLMVPSGMDDVFKAIHLSPQDVPFTLDLNNNTASLYTLLPLDREMRDSYHFHVMATTSGVERLLANVTLDVLDVNDNRPCFSRSMYNITVNANSPALTTLLAVRATDFDTGSQLVYSIVTKSGAQPFAIDPMTGFFSLMHTLDRQSYAVEIQVSDGLFEDQAWIYNTFVHFRTV
ncbi:protocadherin-15-like isoform X2 [Mizuhopecten yessoensis]|uniref:protocadherin-15-like isoform X2 n=1 Tax=Mizuhopecten yessoensis TaxID=6573 RepID=UPI000B45881F|nr:protocadherin-15-like isoform X2 [Mizuhopecten yessoensis]